MFRENHLPPTFALTIPLLVACSGAGSEPVGSQHALTYGRDVKPVIDEKCAGCHQSGGIAPFSLTTYDAIKAVAGPVKEAVSNRTMPPWLAGEGCADYQGDRSLSPEQVDSVVRWIDEGAAEGEPTADQHADELGSGLSRVDLTLSMPSTYSPKESPDEYRCFLIDWPEGETTHVTGFAAKPGNPAIVHHVIAFLIPPDQAESFQAIDDAEDGPGYTCFGGPGGSALTPVGWIGGWAPGSIAGDFPEGTGLEVLPGSKIALQVHYNLVNGAGDDQTAIEVRLEPKVEKKATFQFWTSPTWIFGPEMKIPAGDPEVAHAFSADPTPYMNGGKPFVLHSAFLHMHTRGTSGHLGLVHPGASEECLLDVPRWDFHWQLPYYFEEPKLVQPGDELSIACQWDNSAAHQPVVDGKPIPPTDLAWGEGTGDEMCLGAFYISEP